MRGRGIFQDFRRRRVKCRGPLGMRFGGLGIRTRIKKGIGNQQDQNTPPKGTTRTP